MTVELIYGDSYEIIKNVSDNSIDLVVIDPPYDIQVEQGTGAFGVKKKLNYGEIKGISKGFDFSVLDELCRVMKKINLYIWCSRKQILPLLKYFVEQKKCYWTPINWCKDNTVPTCNNKYRSDVETCLFFREKGVPLYGTAYSKVTYYVTHTNKEDKKKYNHPTVKPLQIIKNFIINSSKEGDLVLDIFSGSGTTAVACEELKRRCIAIENNEKYFKTSVARLEATIEQMKTKEKEI